jgi:hypothetical protein
MFWGYKIVRSQTFTDLQRASVTDIHVAVYPLPYSLLALPDTSGMSQSGSVLRKKVLPRRIVLPFPHVIRARSVQGHVTHIVFILFSVDSSLLLSSCNVSPIWRTLHQSQAPPVTRQPHHINISLEFPSKALLFLP